MILNRHHRAEPIKLDAETRAAPHGGSTPFACPNRGGASATPPASHDLSCNQTGNARSKRPGAAPRQAHPAHTGALNRKQAQPQNAWRVVIQTMFHIHEPG